MTPPNVLQALRSGKSFQQDLCWNFVMRRRQLVPRISDFILDLLSQFNIFNLIKNLVIFPK